MRVSIRSSDEPSTMFSGEHLPPFYLSYFYNIYFPPVDLLLSVLRCSSFRTRDIPCSLILPWTPPITCCLVDSWTACRSRLLKCRCVSSSTTVVGVLPHVYCWR